MLDANSYPTVDTVVDDGCLSTVMKLKGGRSECGVSLYILFDAMYCWLLHRDIAYALCMYVGRCYAMEFQLSSARPLHRRSSL